MFQVSGGYLSYSFLFLRFFSQFLSISHWCSSLSNFLLPISSLTAFSETVPHVHIFQMEVLNKSSKPIADLSSINGIKTTVIDRQNCITLIDILANTWIHTLTFLRLMKSILRNAGTSEQKIWTTCHANLRTKTALARYIFLMKNAAKHCVCDQTIKS